MAKVAWKEVCRFAFLTHFIMFSYISLATSVSVDLTELRNKVSKIQVNPRGNLWATGHFMGKKSVADSLLLESAKEGASAAAGTPVRMRALGEPLLRDPRRDAPDAAHSSLPETDLMMKILKSFGWKRRK
ncbi:bombesin-like [Scleropages formosus]|uniref:Neuromedin-B-like n=1 Tax=Scleropages formosus TaxID=113540 RepID=A0A8C9S451_SCLFO|nr:neuromedin-B [Scleropages formosus]